MQDLRNFLLDALASWAETFPDDIDPTKLIDDETLKFNGLLRAVSIDPSILDTPLLGQLKTHVRSGVEQGHLAARAAFDHLRTKLPTYGLALPHGVTASSLRVENMAARIYSQLEASSV